MSLTPPGTRRRKRPGAGDPDAQRECHRLCCPWPTFWPYGLRLARTRFTEGQLWRRAPGTAVSALLSHRKPPPVSSGPRAGRSPQAPCPRSCGETSVPLGVFLSLPPLGILGEVFAGSAALPCGLGPTIPATRAPPGWFHSHLPQGAATWALRGSVIPRPVGTAVCLQKEQDPSSPSQSLVKWRDGRSPLASTSAGRGVQGQSPGFSSLTQHREPEAEHMDPV